MVFLTLRPPAPESSAAQAGTSVWSEEDEIWDEAERLEVPAAFSTYQPSRARAGYTAVVLRMLALHLHMLRNH
ncbi:MAG: hypothetical protein U0892_15095 [Pirellulales bacterium]